MYNVPSMRNGDAAEEDVSAVQSPVKAMKKRQRRQDKRFEPSMVKMSGHYERHKSRTKIERDTSKYKWSKAYQM